ncbi:MAG: sensor domain-containing diguanylate cyclase [Candidatus Thiodiazotropha weberae]|nr:sensor domain-containing diguanylate cyclase [Candidatus Thiodiazotropha weberae]
MINTETSLDKKLVKKPSFIIFFLKIFIPATITLYGTLFYIIQQTQSQDKQIIVAREQSALKSAGDFTSTLFKDKLSDLFVLSEGEILRKYLQNDSLLNWIELNRAFSLFVRRKPYYDQIRLINANGKEVTRVNKTSGDPEIVPKTELQDKSDRYYYQNAITLAQGEIYISPLDLNMEQGKIEKPIVPTIRFATPVYDGYGKKRGVLIINYTPIELLQKIKDIFKSLRGKVTMHNSDGYWLMGAEKEKLWGFMYSSKVTFESEEPEVWKEIKHGSNSGLITTSTGVYIFQRAYPLNRHTIGTLENIQLGADAFIRKNGDRYWVYISYLSNETISQQSSIPVYMSTILYVLIFIVISLTSGFLATNGIQKKTASLKLLQEANTDELTGLYNRRELNKIAGIEFKRAKRFNRDYSILIIDLDNFKKVNDTYGHTIGDQILQHNANIFLDSTRSEDLLARYGGEEFVMLLPETDIEGARLLAQRICDDVRSKPFDSSHENIATTVSIGISQIDQNDESYTDILERSDIALYMAKRTGKNRVEAI